MRDHYAINKQMNPIFDTWVYIICVHRSTLRSKCTQIRKILLLVCCYDDSSRIRRNFRKMISFCWRKNISIWWKVFPLRMMKNCFKLMTMKNCFKWQCCCFWISGLPLWFSEGGGYLKTVVQLATVRSIGKHYSNVTLLWYPAFTVI